MANSRLCSVPDCGKPTCNARGWCNAHYLRWWKHGDPLYQKLTATCSVDGCKRMARARGWCMSHYSRWREFGDPSGLSTKKGEAIAYLENTVLMHSGESCLLWPYAADGKGYGRITIAGKTQNVCRYVCTAIHGPPPMPKLEAAHSCGKGHLGCVNPGHLSWKTSAGNHFDMVIHGTRRRGQKSHFAKLTETQVREIRTLAGKLSAVKIAEMYGVGDKNIYSILAKKSWAHLD